MADIATIWNAGTSTGDWKVEPPESFIWVDHLGNSVTDGQGRPVDAYFRAGGLVEGNDLYTALLISLFTDAQASDDDVIPDGSTDSRGWWGGPIGSKLWLRARSKATAALPAQIKDDISQATAWMLTDDVAAAIDITVEYQTPTMIGAIVQVRRRDGARAALRFSRLWESF